MVYFTVICFLFISCCVISCAVAVVVEDAEKGCIINKGDHLLLEYSFFQDNDVMYEVKRPNPLFYFEYEEFNNIITEMKSMCKGDTKIIPLPENLETAFFYAPNVDFSSLTHISVTIVHKTSPEEYKIFDYIREDNSDDLVDLLRDHPRSNVAVNQWGETPLIAAIQENKITMFAYLLNGRLPKADVNYAKPEGHTALFAACKYKHPVFTKALLQRGADPNLSLQIRGSKGTTPLHFACARRFIEHAKLLLAYGANPDAVNESGEKPIDVLPSSMMPHERLHFQRIFDSSTSIEASRQDKKRRHTDL